MASIEQLESALRNADAAGDTTAARMLAAEVVKVRSSAPKQAVTPNPNAIGGVGEEINRSVNENLDTISAAGPQGFDPKNYNSFQSTLNVGKALAAIPGLLAAPVTGAARSLIGRGFDAVSPLSQEQRDKFGLESGRDVADTAMMGLSPRGTSPMGPRMAPTAPPAIPELKQAAKDVWNSPQIKSIQVQPGDVAKLADTTSKDLLAQGFRPTPNNAPATLAELDNMIPTSANTLSVDDLRAAKRALQKTAGQIDPATFKATPDAAAAKQAMAEIDKFLDNLSPDLKKANANYSAAKSAERLDYRTIKADRRSAMSGSGMNIENTMRQEVDKISPRGLTPDQLAKREEIVLGTRPRNALRTAGKLGVDGGLSLMLHGGAALGTGGTTLPITIAGTLARKAGEGLTRKAIADLSKSIRLNSPLAKSLAPVALPSPNPFLGLSASQLSLAELLGMLRPVPALMPSRAEREQQ